MDGGGLRRQQIGFDDFAMVSSRLRRLCRLRRALWGLVYRRDVLGVEAIFCYGPSGWGGCSAVDRRLSRLEGDHCLCE